jgi:hypothetical protein
METVKVMQPKAPAGAKGIIQPQTNTARRTTQQRLDDATVRRLNARRAARGYEAARPTCCRLLRIELGDREDMAIINPALLL